MDPAKLYKNTISSTENKKDPPYFIKGKKPTDEQMDIIFEAIKKAGLERKDPTLILRKIFVQVKE